MEFKVAETLDEAGRPQFSVQLEYVDNITNKPCWENKAGGLISLTQAKIYIKHLKSLANPIYHNNF